MVSPLFRSDNPLLALRFSLFRRGPLASRSSPFALLLEPFTRSPAQLRPVFYITEPAAL